jgi:tripartite-type tricarboxylate transporter receptor subunit TctC
MVGAVASDPAHAQADFPAKPIHIFIPFGAGGVADLTMRLLGQKLTERTNQPGHHRKSSGRRRHAGREGGARCAA